MPSKNAIIFTVIYLIINSVIFCMSFNNQLSTYWSFNIILSLLFSGIFGAKINLYISLFYLALSTVIFYGLANAAKRKFEIAILLILGIAITIPILNANGI